MSEHLDEAVLHGELNDLDRKHLEACERCRTLAAGVGRDQAVLLAAMEYFLGDDDFDHRFAAAEAVAEVPQLPMRPRRLWLPVAFATGGAALFGLWWVASSGIGVTPVTPAQPRPQPSVLEPSTASPRPPPAPTLLERITAPLSAGSALECGEVEMEMEGPDCAVRELTCGDVVEGHTEGGGNRYGTRFYERNFCWPAVIPHDDASERVYRLVLPEGDRRVSLTLESPCADLDLAAMKLAGDTCPTAESMPPMCEMNPKPGNQTEVVQLVSQRASTWWVVVEGKRDNGAYRLSVECETGLQ